MHTVHTNPKRERGQRTPSRQKDGFDTTPAKHVLTSLSLQVSKCVKYANLPNYLVSTRGGAGAARRMRRFSMTILGGKALLPLRDRSVSTSHW